MKNMFANHLPFIGYRMVLVVLLTSFFFSSGMQAQSKLTLDDARRLVATERAELDLTIEDLNDFIITDQYTDKHNNVTHVYLQQRHKGIEIEGAVMSLHFKGASEMLHVADGFEKRITGRIRAGRSNLSAVEAVRRASAELGLTSKKSLALLKQSTTKDRASLIDKGSIAQRYIPAKLVYQADQDGHLKLVWKVEIYTTDGQHYWQMKVDAGDGRILEKRDLVLHCDFGHPVAGPGACVQGHGAAGGNLAHQSAVSFGFASTAAETNAPVVAPAYRIYDAPAETPNHGGRSLVYTNGDPVASPLGWHSDGLLSYRVTKGNNVYAYEDRLGVNAGTPASGGLNPLQPLNFDFPLDLSQTPDTYKDAAVTNLFYWNNIVHDVFYHYGFTEAAGNFQNNNFSKGGLGLDGVMAEAQDGGGTNNANFLTLPDGLPGRMQMYLWSSNEITELVHIDASQSYPSGGPSFTAIPAAFGPALDETGIAGDLIIIEANVNGSSTCSSCGCGTGQGIGLPPNNNVLGKIVLIDRGDCGFIEKVMSAQLGGAAGAIVVNNTPGEGPIAMGGDETGAAILIPSVMVSYEDGLELKDEIALGNVQIGLRRLTPAPPMKDGDLDNGIITHEYGHGISTRLTGGPSQTCLSGDEQAGEGWSDFFGLLMTMDQATLADGGYAGRGIGTYVFDQGIDGNGIRPARYARDMSINPYTYENINNAEITVPHGVGFIFCTALWDMTWNLIDEYGYNPDLVNGTIADGNILALQLVIDGLKMQPCAPTFLQSRDAILAADQALTGGANQCFIWEAFAKRGMGYSAVAGTNARGDETEAFDMPPSCEAVVSITQTADARVVNGDEIAYTITLTNSGQFRTGRIEVKVPVPPYTTYVNGSSSHPLTRAPGLLKLERFRLRQNETKVITYRLKVQAPTAGDLYFDDGMEDGINQWNAGIGLNAWSLTDSDAYSGTYSWFAADPNNASNQTLTLAQSVVLPDDAELRFRHKFETEAEFDGGVVELSDNGGLTWYDLGGQISRNAYNSLIPLANNPLINGFAFAGSSNGWIESVADLGLFAGREVKIRYRFSSDVLSGGQGWWIDDVIIGKNLTYVENTAYFTLTRENTFAGTISTLVLDEPSAQLESELPGSAAVNMKPNLNHFAMKAFPNPTHDLVNLTFDQLERGDVKIVISNLQGKRLLEQEFWVESGASSLQLDVSGWPSGLYLLRANQNQKQEILRLVIE